MGVIRTVLLVTDDPARGEAARRRLAAAGYEVHAAPDGLAAEEALAARPPDVLVVEMLLPGQSGFALAGRAKDLSGGRTRVVMMAADPPAAHRDYAYAAGVDVIAPPAGLLD
ncbi:MAG: response regulator, partial [Gemmataceae bacterium]|nr:response regulator [Gemmataceae bacterium]